MASKNASPCSTSSQRFTDISGEHKRMMAPISGYEKMPLVSIDQAIEPLDSYVPEIKRMVWTVKENCSSPAHGLTTDESASIMLYTLEWKTREASFYFIFNKLLRAPDRNRLKPWFLYLKLLIFSLSKLPSHNLHVYRGIKEDLHAAYPKDSSFVWWGFSSCTTTIDVLSQPEFLGMTGPRTIFNIETNSGKDISEYSIIPTEKEVLLPAARKFVVIGTLHPAKDLHIIQIKEIEPPFPLLERLDEPIIPNPAPMQQEIKSIPPYPARWKMDGVTVAGGNGAGRGTKHLCSPSGLFVDVDQTVYIADYENHRIMAWKAGNKAGEVVAGGNDAGDELNQLNYPNDIMVDRKNNSLLICDGDNGRVMRWSRHSSSHDDPEIVIDNIACYALAMDNQGFLYVSDVDKHEVRRYDGEDDKEGIVIAGGRGKGTRLNQLNVPAYLFVDAQSTLYISDSSNHRVMAWMKGAEEGIVVAGGNGSGKDLTQLYYPKGVWVDGYGHVYVVDKGNNRVMRWEKGAKQGTLIVGGNDEELQTNPLSGPVGLFFDQHGQLYVTDCENNRVQRFSLC